MYTVAISSTLLPYNTSGDMPIASAQVLPCQSVRGIINDTVGYESAEVSLRMQPQNINSIWNYIGNHIIIYDKRQVVVWEGFVNKITAQYRGAEWGIGPVTDLANKIRISYREIDWGVPPVQTSGTLLTDWYTDDYSVKQWGLLEAEYSISRELSEEEAIQAATSTLAKVSKIKSYKRLASGGDNQAGYIDVMFNCNGYYHLLSRSYYSYYEEGETWDIGEALTDAISANKLISLAGINNIGISIGKYTGEWDSPSRPVSSVIDDYFKVLDDSDGYGYVFGIFENRTARFFKVVKPLQAQYAIHPQTGRITDISKTDIVSIPMPGEWVLLSTSPSFMPDEMDTDAMFPISSVEFMDDGTITLNEKIESTLSSSISGGNVSYVPEITGGRSGKGKGVTAHGGLSGLSNDDHPQYWNNARGAVQVEAIVSGYEWGETGHAPVTAANSSINVTGQAIRVDLRDAQHGGSSMGVDNGLYVNAASDHSVQDNFRKVVRSNENGWYKAFWLAAGKQVSTPTLGGTGTDMNIINNAKPIIVTTPTLALKADTYAVGPVTTEDRLIINKGYDVRVPGSNDYARVTLEDVNGDLCLVAQKLAGNSADDTPRETLKDKYEGLADKFRPAPQLDEMFIRGLEGTAIPAPAPAEGQEQRHLGTYPDIA